VQVLIYMAILMALDYYVLSWKEYQVVAKEGHSETISIVTVRKSKSGLEGVLLSADQRREQQERLWKEGIWTLQVSDYIKRFPRIYGNVSPYTPLPPLDRQDPASRRLLVHREDAVHEKLSKRGSLIRMARPYWIGYSASIPKDVQQVVLFASGVTGIAPMLQTIHTLLEARRGDGIDGRRPDIHVVWFKQNPERVNENGMAPSYTTSLEASTADKIASAELERFRLLHPDNLVIESVDVGSTLAQGTEVLESAPQRHLKIVKTSKVPKLLIISGSRSFADSLAGENEGRSFTEDGPSILTKAERAGWKILDLSTMKVCN
jgi:cytochrome-b5 reductase